MTPFYGTIVIILFLFFSLEIDKSIIDDDEINCILNSADEEDTEKDNNISEKLIFDVGMETLHLGDSTIFTGELVIIKKVKNLNSMF